MTEVNGHGREVTTLSMTETVVVERDGSASPPKFGVESPVTDVPQAAEQHRRPRPVREETLDPRVPLKTIPPDHNHRTLVLCFDGTGDQFDADNSNIVRLVSLLKKNDKTKQMVYYQSGIGTYTTPQIATPLMSSFSKVLDEMFAWNLHAHVMEGYEFLMQNYKEGDKICIFGFSRGAYTARSLAGMIHKVGLLPAGNIQQVPFAYKMYLRANSCGWEQSTAFKSTFSVDVPIEFLGVWDTVDSVGLIPKRLPFTTSNTIVRTFRHAVSLDERRSKFKANLWNVPDEVEEKLGFHAAESEPPTPRGSRFLSLPAIAKEMIAGRRHSDQSDDSKHSGHESQEDRIQDTLERKYSEKRRKTDVEEVWFAGCHCDVGGGSVADKTRHSLARIPLRWMIRECFKTNSGIMFDTEGLRSLGMDPMALYPFVTPRPPALPVEQERICRIPPPPPSKLKRLFSLRKTTAGVTSEPSSPIGTEEEEELKDAMSPAYDQLKLKFFWWFLEVLPLDLRYQNGENQWVSQVGCNFARPRFIPQQRKHGIKVHRSVKTRMDAEFEGRKGKHYKQRALFRVDPTWVD